MTKKHARWLVVVLLLVAGFAGIEYMDRHPGSATLPEWIQGEFAASAERYAGRTVTVDSSAIRFSRGASPADVLPIEWINEVKDARAHIRILDLHVRDGDVPSTIRLIASSQDSSFRLQTMPDVAWRRLSDREARAARVLAHDLTVTDSAGVATAAAIPSGASRPATVPSDTVIRERRFADRDPVARDELTQVVAACRRYGCRIGIQGLQQSRFAEFATVLRALGADSVSLTPEPSANTSLVMLEITPGRTRSRRP
jgi:hypothetical protein